VKDARRHVSDDTFADVIDALAEVADASAGELSAALAMSRRCVASALYEAEALGIVVGRYIGGRTQTGANHEIRWVLA
jgi:hypothetical protein